MRGEVPAQNNQGTPRVPLRCGNGPACVELGVTVFALLCFGPRVAAAQTVQERRVAYSARYAHVGARASRIVVPAHTIQVHVANEKGTLLDARELPAALQRILQQMRAL